MPTSVRRAPKVLCGLVACVSAATLVGCGADPPSGVVGLAVTGCPPDTAHGTGVVVAPGLVLTSAHVLKGADEIMVSNGRRSTLGEIVAFDPEMDLAYVRIEPDFAAPLTLADDLVERGVRGHAYVFRDGAAQVIPVRVRRPVEIHTEDIYIDGDTYRAGYELEADIEAGDSGGPVMVAGEVVGVLWARSRKFDSRAYAIDPVRAGATVRAQLRDHAIDGTIDLERCT